MLILIKQAETQDIFSFKFPWKQIKHFTCNSDYIESLFFMVTIASHFPPAYPLMQTSPLSSLLPCCLLQSVWVLRYSLCSFCMIHTLNIVATGSVMYMSTTHKHVKSF